MHTTCMPQNFTADRLFVHLALPTKTIFKPNRSSVTHPIIHGTIGDRSVLPTLGLICYDRRSLTKGDCDDH
jgi:hypothetical protein